MMNVRHLLGQVVEAQLSTIARAEAVVEYDGKISRSRRYYFSSAKLPAKAFATAVRAH
jgi:hypothetical protein